MARTKRHDQVLVRLFIRCVAQGLNNKEISRETGLSKSSVIAWKRQLKSEGTIVSRPRGGRPSIIDERTMRKIHRSVKDDGNLSLNQRLSALQLPISRSTLRRALISIREAKDSK